MKIPRLCLLMALVPLATLAAPPADGSVINLWPEGVPGQVADASAEKFEDGRWSQVHAPTLTYYAAGVDRPTRTAVIVCPGGGYGFLSWEREGVQYAKWLNTLGVSAFILKSRLKEYDHPRPLQDVLRALRYVRANAADLGIEPDRIGVMGSSAGGHLAASASTLFDLPEGRTGADIDAVSARPDFAILMYPVISMIDGVTHAGSKANLIGADASPDLVALTSLEQQVSAATPPTLLIHTQADTSVPIENSIRYFQALTAAGVPGELYAYERGSHGMGMVDGLGTSSAWPARAAEWLRERGLLTPPAKAK